MIIYVINLKPDLLYMQVKPVQCVVITKVRTNSYILKLNKERNVTVKLVSILQ